MILEQNGICYPDFQFGFPGIPDNRNGHFLVHRVWDDEHKHRQRRREQEIFEEGFAKIQQYVKKYEKILLSEETLWNDKEMLQKKYEKIKSACENIGAKLVIVVYLRRQDLVMPSYWGQLVKNRLSLSFSEFIQSGQCQSYRLDYAAHLQRIECVVGKENIIVRPYETGQYRGMEKSIYSDFLQIFGLEMTNAFHVQREERNVRLDKRSMELKAQFNKNPYYHDKKSFFVELLKQFSEVQEKKVEYYFDSQGQKDFYKRYEEGNAQVARRYLNREDGILFYDPMPDEAHTETSYSCEDLLFFCGELFAFEEERKKQQAQDNIKQQLGGRLIKLLKRLRKGK